MRRVEGPNSDEVLEHKTVDAQSKLLGPAGDTISVLAHGDSTYRDGVVLSIS